MSTLSKRTIRIPAVAAAVLSAGLLLGACGGEGGGGGKSSDAIEGAGKDAGSDKSASASASPSKEAGAPSFDLPSDLTLKVEKTDTGDAAKDEALRDAVYSMKAEQEAYTKGTPGTKNFVRYWKYPAVQTVGKDVVAMHKKGLTLTGTYLYYDFKVRNMEKKKSAWVTFCESARKAYGKKIKSGKVLKTKPSMDDFAQYTAGMVKNAKGDWQVTRTKRESGVKACAR